MTEHPPETAREERPAPITFDFSSLPPVPERSAWSAEWWLALGHLRGGGGEAFVSLVTMISMAGVTLGVAALIAVMSVMTGFEQDLRDKILGANAHVVVMHMLQRAEPSEEVLDAIESVDGVAAVAPFVYAEAVVNSRLGGGGAIVKGAHPERTPTVTRIRDQLVLGMEGELVTPEQKAATFARLFEDNPGQRVDDEEAYPGILIGVEMQQHLQVIPGNRIQLINPFGGGRGIFGKLTTTAQTFRLVGVFDSGMYEYDTKWVYVDNAQAQKFLKLDGTVTGFELKVDDIDAVERIKTDLEEAVGYPYYARHWIELNSALFDALTLEKVVMALIMSLVTLVAGMLIVSNLFMLVLTKRREIAILMATGASPGSILRTFVMTGGIIGLVGTVAGTLLGLVVCWGLKAYGWPLDTDVYYLSSLPVVVQPQDVMLVAGLAFAVCLLAACYPAWRASTLHPVEGLRYE
ncbi:MAG: FtsX-like permease family protein [Myxococcota bacterium]